MGWEDTGIQPVETSKPNWFHNLTGWIRWPITAVVFIGLLCFVVPAIVAGRNINVGGLLGLLFRRKSTKFTIPTVATSNSIPKKRQVAPGEPDTSGHIQIFQQPIVIPTNPFRDRTVVNTPAGPVQLPDGLVDTDVQAVTVIGTSGAIVHPKQENSLVDAGSIPLDELMLQLAKARQAAAAQKKQG
jgi:hypothetical protein